MLQNSTLRLLPITLVALSGCTIIADVNSYKTDNGCDLNMQLTAFSAHFNGPHRMEFFVVKPSAADPRGTLASVLVLDPTPAINFDIDMPNAIPDRSHEIRFYADTDNNRIVQPVIGTVTQDHTWIVPQVCEPQPIPFEHVFNFQSFERPIGRDADLVMRVSNIPEAGGAFEVSVIVRDVPDPTQPSIFVERTVGVFHKPKRDDNAGTPMDPFEITIPGIVDSGIDYTIEVWADGDGDGLFDPNDGGGPFAGTDDRFWRIGVSGEELNNVGFPFEFDATSQRVAGQNEHSGVLVVTTP